MSRVKEIFVEALERHGDERAAYLDQACADDVALRAEVEAFLSAAAKTHAFAQTEHPTIAERPGAVVGRYKLLEQIGEGGFGVVFMAEQVTPVRRRVAIKVIKPGYDSQQVIARFEAERQALALMDHPNIAKVFDGGATETGRPYFVMELVHGVPITEYCDKNGLPPRERLQLFVLACRAVQHAHTKGIIHRDIKPTNVLVTLHEGIAVPKVIDFGVAKATGQQLTEKTLFTNFAQMVGTPLYMSPEQAEMTGVDVDTRSDVYSLGVLLYELLTGTTPLDKDRLKRSAFDEIRRIIREEEPPRPSTRLSTLGDQAKPISARRKSGPAQLGRLIRGDLDWIVMKALEKDRSRRYETAIGFAMDVQRYLVGEAVQAHPPSTAYRLKKFARRNKGRVIAASLVLIALVAGIVGTTLGLLKARKNLEQANANLAFAQKANEILGSVFTGLDPSESYSTLGEFSQDLKSHLRKAVQELDGSSLGDPVTVARMQGMLGNSLLGLGEPGEAIGLFDKARATLTAKLGPDHPETLRSMVLLGLGYLHTGKLDLAVSLLEETLKLTKAKLGPTHPDTLTCMNNLAEAYEGAGKIDLAVPLLEETLKLDKSAPGREESETLAPMGNLAACYIAQEKFDLALPLLEETLKLKKAKLGPDDPSTLMTMNNLATGYSEAGHPEKAVPLYEETLKLQEQRLGRQHPQTQTTVGNLGVAYKDTGRIEEALPLLEEVAHAAKKIPALRGMEAQLLDAYEKAGKTADAAKLVKELLSDVRTQLPKDSPQLPAVLARYGLSLMQAHAFAEAEPLLRECLTIREKTMPDDWRTFNTEALLGGALLGQNRYADAEPLLLKGYEGMKQRERTIPQAGVTRLPEALDRLIELYTETNRPDEATKWRAERARYPEAKKE